LISRFKWGLSADLQSPDLETRMAIVFAKLDNEKVELPQEIVEFISFNVKENVRELEGVLVSLIAQSSLNNKEIDRELAKNVVDSFITGSSKEITIDNIKQLVSDHLKVSVEKIQGKTRKRTERVLPFSSKSVCWLATLKSSVELLPVINPS